MFFMLDEFNNKPKRYYSLNKFLREKFGKKTFKINLNADFTCPNRDGTVSYEGCIFCSESGSGDFAGDKNDDLITQFQQIKTNIHKKWPDAVYIGYFQANSNTYAPVSELKNKYEEILKQKNVVGLAIATRADCLNEEVLSYLDELSKKTFLIIELGLQSIHPQTNKLINRGHDLKTFNEAVYKLKKSNIHVVAHIINGLPYENKEMMLETVTHLNKLPINGIKFHMLYILKNTPLAKLYEKEKFPLLTKNEYIDIVCQQINILRPNIVVHRLTSDPNLNDLIAPKWLKNKFQLLNAIDDELSKRNIDQKKNEY